MMVGHAFLWSRSLAGGLLLAALLAQASQRPDEESSGTGSEAAARRAGSKAQPPQTEFTFARLVFRGGSGWRFGAWATDAPKADITFIAGIRRLTNLDVRESHYYVPITSPGAVPLPLSVRGGTFARLVFRGGSGWRFGAWATDAPKADITFIAGIRRLTNLDVRESHYYVPITSPELFHYPFLYAVEVGHLELSSQEAEILREYFKRGGFMVVDDFHGTLEWSNFQSQMHKVFPGGRIEDLPASHPLFHCFFDIEELFQIPGVIMFYSGTTYEKDGYNPHFRGVFDEDGQLKVMINFNSDLGDAWEWADVPFYPEKYSSAAYRLGINYIIYSMTH